MMTLLTVLSIAVFSLVVWYLSERERKKHNRKHKRNLLPAEADVAVQVKRGVDNHPRVEELKQEINEVNPYKIFVFGCRAEEFKRVQVLIRGVLKFFKIAPNKKKNRQGGECREQEGRGVAAVAQYERVDKLGHNPRAVDADQIDSSYFARNVIS